MVATDRITAAAEIDPSYLPGGATVYPHVKHGAAGSHECLLRTTSHPLIRLCAIHGGDQHSNRHTDLGMLRHIGIRRMTVT